ncbi:MAG: phosphate signaling complex protein PhoU [Thermoguttaceae bacterium]
MKAHFDYEVEQLNRLISSQAIAVEATVRRATQSVAEKDAQLALDVEQNDDKIDEMEVHIEEECLKVLALHQPVAGDLRYIITLLKVNTELERIGDLAVYIARRAGHIASSPQEGHLPDYSDMIFQVITNLKMAFDAFLYHDVQLAAQVIAGDDVIDHFHNANKCQIAAMIKTNPLAVDVLLDFMAISRSLERIADSCTNIGEDVLYLEQGRIMRHVRGERGSHPTEKG